MRMVKRVRQRFPDLPLIARAHGRTDAYEYAEMGVTAVRELFGSSVAAAERLLVALGYEPEAAQRVVERFRDYDERQITAQAPFRRDTEKLIALGEQGRRDIAQLLASEIDQHDARPDRERGEHEMAGQRVS